MLDSPYVRRVAISLHCLGLPFEHRSISVFRAYDEFAAINPVVKAPSLVCDDGEVLMDSSLILDYAESIAPAGRSLLPPGRAARQHDLRLAGLSLAACEKMVQIVYEETLRPIERQHPPWLDRVTKQLRLALSLLEAELVAAPLLAKEGSLTQAGITAAVAWEFCVSGRPDRFGLAAHPALAAFAAAAERLPAFVAWPPH